MVLSHNTIVWVFSFSQTEIGFLFFMFYLRFLGNQGERCNNIKEKVNRKFSRCLTVLIIIECNNYIDMIYFQWNSIIWRILNFNEHLGIVLYGNIKVAEQSV